MEIETELKTPSTFSQQIDKIKQNGFIVDDDAELERFLKRVYYYRFSAYFLPYKNIIPENNDSINIRNIIKIYDFDMRFHAIILSVIEDIEVHVKTQISHYHAHEYTALGYLNKKNFNQKHSHDKFMKKIKELIDWNKREPVIQHHVIKYGGRFPLWVIIGFFPIGMVSYFYADLISHDKKEIAKEFNTHPVIMESWLRCITDLRNKCAHYGRLYNWNFPSLPKFEKNNSYPKTHKLYTQLLMLKEFYCDKDRWNKYFLPQIESTVDEFKEYIDFPENWDKILRKIN